MFELIIVGFIISRFSAASCTCICDVFYDKSYENVIQF